jgi:ABC-2 type transport system permease protein
MLDPMCLSDRPNRQQMQYMQEPPNPSSDLPQLLKAWKLEMPENQVVGDRDIALVASMSQNANPGKIITYLGFNRQCFNPDNIIGANLNDVRFLFAGALKPIEDPNYKITLTPIVHTTAKGSTFQLTPYEMMMPEPEHLMSKYMEGMAPVNMGYLVTGKLRSAFPNGIEVAIDPNKPEDSNGVKADPNKPKPTKKTIKGLVQATNDCAVAVYSDVDFISDMLAYQHSFFGSAVVGDNAALLMNTVDDLCGSSDLIAIRSRGNFQRPFTVVDKIESDAEKATADEESKINAQIQGFQQDLNNIVSKAKEGDEQVIGNEVLKKKRQIEENLRAAQARLREVKAKRRENIEAMGNKLRNVNCAAAPAFILVIAIGLGIRRSFRRRHYISHASDS